MWSQFLLLDRGVALQLDSLDSSHPIYAKINDPTEIAQQFDSITYSKGSSIIRMLEGYLNLQSKENKKNRRIIFFIDSSFFTTGLTNYLNEHAYGNARNIDLWNALASTSGDSNLVSMMTSWTKLTGISLPLFISHSRLSFNYLGNHPCWLKALSVSLPPYWYCRVLCMERSNIDKSSKYWRKASYAQ